MVVFRVFLWIRFAGVLYEETLGASVVVVAHVYINQLSSKAVHSQIGQGLTASC